MLGRQSPPPWFWALVAVVIIIIITATGGYDAPAAPVSLAFWGWLVIIGQAIWTGLQVAGKAILAALVVSVNALWIFARALFTGLSALGSAVLQGLRLAVWRLMQLYDHVLKPAWQKFWGFIEWTRTALDKIFRPVFKVLFRIRSELLKFYDKWVKPILDSIDVARKILRVFSSLGLEWAKKLDQKLGQIAEAIDRPFRELLHKLNEVINLVNRVVTADGLFQRLALIRSIERDIKFVMNEWWNAVHRDPTDEERARLEAKDGPRPLTEVVGVMRDYLVNGAGADRAIIDEAAADLAIRLRDVRPMRSVGP